jgi:hypothetical protein
MRKIILLVGFFCLCLPLSPLALLAGEITRISALPAGTTFLCQTEQTIGFRWVRGKWKSTDFIAEHYIIEKLAASSEGKNHAGCLGLSELKGISDGEKVMVPGCYAIRRHDQKSAGIRAQVCTEAYVQEGGSWQVESIDCEKFKMQPDGWFHRSSLHADLEDDPEGDVKDPLSVAVGHCRIAE